jgi:hypothetical protein
MWPRPLKITQAELPASAMFVVELASGEKLYSYGGRVYAVQPIRRRGGPMND